ncbi:MAG: hypothetical protein HY237_13030 [Acidobacteria bacterium]|nr:hypothetical protein [Acidobacteriota bacterium]
METALSVIDLNHRPAPVERRERFWANRSRRSDTRQQLAGAAGKKTRYNPSCAVLADNN